MSKRIPWLHRFGRRNFLKTGALAAGAAVIGCGGESSDGAIELTHPLIIGTGFGGSITAHRLTQAGISCTVLERGRRYEITPEGDTFASLRTPDGRVAWLSERTHIGFSTPIDRYVGIVEKFAGDNLDVMIGSAVGGGSLAWAGMMVKPHAPTFDTVFSGTGIQFSDLEEGGWYDRVAEMLPPRRVPDEVLNSTNYGATVLFRQHAEAAGLDWEFNTCAIDWDLILAEINGELPEEASVGDYLYGLNSGAKGQTDRTYLAAAEGTGLCDVLTLHQVREVGVAAGGGYEVVVEVIDEVGTILETKTFRAPALFMSAGSVHSTRLLIEARAAGRMPDLPAAAGEGWGNNGQHLAQRNGVGEVPLYQGGPPAIVIRSFDNPVAPITVEHGAAAFGFDCGCMILPTSSVNDGFGRLRYDADMARTVLEWDPSNGATAIDAADWVLDTLNTANGGMTAPIIGDMRLSTFHPLGGLVMGEVTDSYGRVSDHPGLYVLDGALIPGSTPTANPAWTISAVVERAIDSIIREDLT